MVVRFHPRERCDKGCRTNQQQTERLIDMAHTFKTDPWHVKEARGVAWHPTQFAREHSPYTKARRDIAKRIRARERREMDRIARDMEAWGDYFPTGATLREFATDTNRDGWQF
nr:MAG TPA: hypothetical protein [Caudoviricetes sp.]